MSGLKAIEIVGGGLAGLSLGLALRREGVPVTLFEAGSYPRHRVCGEFITGLSPATVERLGLAPVLADARHHREVAWFIDGQPARVQQLPAPALGLSRFALDARLAAAFDAAGGELRTDTRVTDDTPRAGRVFANGRRRGRSPWLGLKIHALDLSLERDLELHLGDEVYVGLARVEDNRVNVCGLFRRRQLAAPGAELLLRYLDAAGLPALAARLRAARFDPASFSAVAAVCFDPSVPTAARVQLGDACAMIPPFTGNGMAMAFQSAETALGPLLAYSRGRSDWRAAGALIAARLRRRFRVRLASARLLHPYLLQRPRQRLLAVLARARLLPFRSFYSLLH
ncbi:MAG: NAD(P)-binding protein [Opitutae bacterium]|nr:NAD(P)-binding protein [Opitutae bacterium]